MSFEFRDSRKRRRKYYFEMTLTTKFMIEIKRCMVFSSIYAYEREALNIDDYIVFAFSLIYTD